MAWCSVVRWCVRFEEVAPVRSFVMGRHVGYESWLERDQLMVLDFDPQAAAVASQPFCLYWPAGDRVRRHVPNFFVRRVDGVGVVVDVRADERVEPVDAEAFVATAAAGDAVGWQFQLAVFPVPCHLLWRPALARRPGVLRPGDQVGFDDTGVWAAGTERDPDGIRVRGHDRRGLIRAASMMPRARLLGATCGMANLP